MSKRTPEKAPLPEPEKAVKKAKNKVNNKKSSAAAAAKPKPAAPKKKPEKKETVRKAAPKKAAASPAKKDGSKPGLRSVYSNSRHTLLPLGFATDFKTNSPVVIFSNLSTGQVHTIPLTAWNRWKLKEVKKINTET